MRGKDSKSADEKVVTALIEQAGFVSCDLSSHEPPYSILAAGLYGAVNMFLNREGLTDAEEEAIFAPDKENPSLIKTDSCMYALMQPIRPSLVVTIVVFGRAKKDEAAYLFVYDKQNPGPVTLVSFAELGAKLPDKVSAGEFLKICGECRRLTFSDIIKNRSALVAGLKGTGPKH